MTSQPTIELFNEADISQLVQLLQVQLREHKMDCGETGLTAVLIKMQSDPRHGFILLAKIGNQIVGFAIGTLILSPEHQGVVAWLEEFYVSPAERQRGIGASLLEAFFKECRERGVTAIDVEVDADHEKVISLYRRYGFEELPRRRFFRKLDADERSEHVLGEKPNCRG